VFVAKELVGLPPFWRGLRSLVEVLRDWLRRRSRLRSSKVLG